MPRGHRSQIGDRTVNRNGYEYIRTENGWIGSHIVVMEEHLGRRLEPNEFVTFVNGHEPPITVDMLSLRRRGDRKSKAARIAEIESRIEDLQAELQLLKEDVDA
jgi:hypothetical protein